MASRTKKVIIFGAGMTGLSAGRDLARAGHEVVVFEREDHVGGLASTFRDNEGFVYDNGPRFIFSTLAESVGIADLCEPVPYFENLLVGGKYYRFPFGFVRNPLFCLSVGTAMLTRGFKRKPQSLRDFLYTYYGKYFSRRVLQPLIEKWAGIPADEVSTDFASRLLPTNLAYVAHSLIKKIRGGITEDYYKKGRYIVYPRGSNSEIFRVLQEVEGMNVFLNSAVKNISVSDGKIESIQVNGIQHRADVFLSTIPIHHLASYPSLQPALHPWMNLTYRGVIILFVKIDRSRVLDNLWTWFPEEKYPFYRIAEFKNARKDLAPPGKTLISLEFALSSEHSYWEQEKERIFDDVLPQLEELYGLKREEVLGLDIHQSPYAYPVLRRSTEEIQRNLTHQTPLENLFIAGRTGMFQYRMLEGSFESALEASKAIQSYFDGKKTKGPSAVEYDAYGRPLVIPE